MDPQSADSNGDTVLPAFTPYSMVEFMNVLRARWILVLGTVVVVVAAALTLSLTSTKQYDASAKLLIMQTDPVGNLLNPGSTQVVDPERNVATSAELVRLDTVANRVRDTLGLRLTTQDLLSEVSTGAGSTSNVVSVTARDPNPRLAARIANGFATQYVFLRRRSDQTNLNQAANIARSQFAALSPTEQASAEGQQLVARLQELRLAASAQTGGVEVVSRATVPSSPSRPRPVLSGVVGLFLGLVLGGIAALLFEFVDIRLAYRHRRAYRRRLAQSAAANYAETVEHQKPVKDA